MPRVMLGMPATLEKNSTRPETAMQRSLSGPITRVRMDEEGEENVHRFEFKASSDEPVEMWGNTFEILDHSPEAVRLDWPTHTHHSPDYLQSV